MCLSFVIIFTVSRITVFVTDQQLSLQHFSWCRFLLPQAPLAMDCVGSHILLASQPLEIALFEVSISVRVLCLPFMGYIINRSYGLNVLQGQLVPSGNPKASLQLVREISMMDMVSQLALGEKPLPEGRTSAPVALPSCK
jgi:hypothetical protein